MVENFLRDLKERESFYVGKKIITRHTNYDSSSPLKYTHTHTQKTKQKQEFQRSVYRFISLLADCLIEYRVSSRL